MISVDEIQREIREGFNGYKDIISDIGSSIALSESHIISDEIYNIEKSLYPWSIGSRMKILDFIFEMIDTSDYTDENSIIWGVCKITKNKDSILVKVQGRYLSHIGPEVDYPEKWKIVSRVEKTILSYE